jgi:hypothetical protein
MKSFLIGLAGQPDSRIRRRRTDAHPHWKFVPAAFLPA